MFIVIRELWAIEDLDMAPHEDGVFGPFSRRSDAQRVANRCKRDYPDYTYRVLPVQDVAKAAVPGKYVPGERFLTYRGEED